VLQERDDVFAPKHTTVQACMRRQFGLLVATTLPIAL
jgi:hypothetical protein